MLTANTARHSDRSALTTLGPSPLAAVRRAVPAWEYAGALGGRRADHVQAQEGSRLGEQRVLFYC